MSRTEAADAGLSKAKKAAYSSIIGGFALLCICLLAASVSCSSAPPSLAPCSPLPGTHHSTQAPRHPLLVPGRECLWRQEMR
jgi:hypothetical protein